MLGDERRTRRAHLVMPMKPEKGESTSGFSTQQLQRMGAMVDLERIVLQRATTLI